MTIGIGSVDVRSSEHRGGLDPVHLGHADVEEAHVGAEPLGEIYRVHTVGGVPDDLDVRLRIEDHGESRPDEILIVGNDHSYRHPGCPCFGSTALTVHPRPRFGPASSEPPWREARSLIPTSPYPEDDFGST